MIRNKIGILHAKAPPRKSAFNFPNFSRSSGYTGVSTICIIGVSLSNDKRDISRFSRGSLKFHDCFPQ